MQSVAPIVACGGRLRTQLNSASVEVGLVQGKHLTVDGTFVEANVLRRAGFRGSSWRKRHRSIVEEPVHEQDGLDHRSRFHLRHQARHTGSLGTTTTTWWTMTVV